MASVSSWRGSFMAVFRGGRWHAGSEGVQSGAGKPFPRVVRSSPYPAPLLRPKKKGLGCSIIPDKALESEMRLGEMAEKVCSPVLGRRRTDQLCAGAVEG